ncbi:N-anthranilate isomerase [Artomyces pyxidatus]|uniref:N-anthranilate isomerase n=1 Tax=Artomyces pyxidatus TaxID=48021 RepID=A0ACB8SXN9_9AGAM|nr:N-anthranilate isomerase [Artomyces pyxidatus]
MALPAHLARPLDVLMIDNFDSFTWNLYQHLALLGAEVTVIRNDAIPVESIPQLQIRSLIVSPGPGHPVTDSGISRDAIKYFAGRVPVLGVCMGLECLVDVFGGEIAYAGEIMHGKLSRIRHDGRGCFKGLPQGFKSTRYHSLSADVKSLPADLAITAATEDSGVIMGVRHRQYTLEAVQYHPESILSEGGDDLFRNFLALKGGSWEENVESNVLDRALPPFAIEVQTPASSKIPSVLEKIYAQRLKDVEAAKAAPGTTPTDIATFLSMHLSPPLTSLVERLKVKTPALMAEIKRASPSKGPIALSANAAQQALTYALSGAAVISVLTEPTWFKGSLLDLRLARQAIDSLPNRPAILRKDFILDEYQIAEARLHGADTVLLIVAMLPIARLHALYAYSRSLGMEPLVEVNNAREMAVALELGAKVIGVNNRNLHDFQVDMGTTSRLADMVQGREVVLCALSGIQGPEDVRRYVAEGVGAVLVGEALMRAENTRAFIAQLLDWDARPHPEPPLAPLVKICGIRTEAEAVAAADVGADMLGLMFVPSSKRRISLETALAISTVIRQRRAVRGFIPDSASIGNDQNEPWFTSHARRLSKAPSRPLLVGVFQNQPLSFVLHTVAATQLDIVQLHGSEPLEWSKQIPVPVIRAFHVDADGNGLEGLTRPGLHEFLLLDAAAAAGGLSGSSGSRVDWEIARRVVGGGEVIGGGSSSHLPIILAGGLTPDNVAEAIQAVSPWAVDVSGGVENEDGTGKDIEKVSTFITAVKGLH